MKPTPCPNVELWKLPPRNPLLVVLRNVLPRKLLPLKLALRDPNPVPSVCPAPMLPVKPRLPLTDRDVPPPNDELLEPSRELPRIDALDPNRDPAADEPPKCEPSIFETARFAEIAELRPEDDAIIPPRPADAEAPPPIPARGFEATAAPLDPRAEPATDELPDLAFAPAPEFANDRDPAAAFPPARVPAVLPVLGPRALP
ncbi:MAG: hypothetical protein WB007_14010, partial [Candidatus Acidiferrales bacterium]